MSWLSRFRLRRRARVTEHAQEPVQPARLEVYSTPRHRRIPAGGPRWAHADIVQAIQLWHKIHGAPPTYTDWSRARAISRRDQAALLRMGEPGDWPTARQVVRRFGSWNWALEYAGFTPRPRHRPSAGFRPGLAL